MAVRVRRFRKIKAIHCLTAGRPRKTLKARRFRDGKRYGVSFPMDDFLSEDQYVHLSVAGVRDAALYESKEDNPSCYVFDAKDLIRRGAYLRLNDYINTKEFREFKDAAHKVRGWKHKDVRFASAEDLNHLIETDPEAGKAWDKLLQKIQEITFRGEGALEKLPTCKKENFCEILVPEELPLDEAEKKLPGSKAVQTYGGYRRPEES